MRVLLVMLLGALLSGCLVPRKHSALATSAQPLTRTALLPVESPFEYEKNDIPRDKVLRIGNEVMETLAKAKDGNLMGPTEVESILGSNSIPAFLRWEAEAKDIAAGSNVSVAARQAVSQLGVSHVVRCRLNPPYCVTKAAIDQGGVGVSWTCYIDVKMELINLETEAVEQTSRATGMAEQTQGLTMLLIPVCAGTTFGRAVDHAERTALTELFKPDHPELRKP